MQETQIQSLGREDPLEKEMDTHFSILAWEIPWTEEPGGPQSTSGPSHEIHSSLASAHLLNLLSHNTLPSVWVPSTDQRRRNEE